MQFTCAKSELTNAISIVSKGAAKMQKSILECILFSAKDGELTLKATDIELSIITTITAEIIREGAVAIPSKFLYEIINRFPESDIEFIKEEEENTLKVSCLNSTMNLSVLNADDFPEFPVMEKDKCIKIAQESLKTMINKTVFSAAISDDKPVLKGLLFDINKEEISIVGVDGFRMGVRKSMVISELTQKCVIPARTLKEVAKILKDTEETIRISLGTNMALFEIEETQIFTRLLEGEFINYKTIIPKTFETDLTIDKEMLKDSLERVIILAREGNNNVINLDITDKKVDITTNSQIGNIDDEIPVIKNGKDLKISLNAKFLLDILRSVDDKEISINFNTQISPCIIKGTQNSDYEYLVLPVQIRE